MSDMIKFLQMFDLFWSYKWIICILIRVAVGGMCQNSHNCTWQTAGQKTDGFPQAIQQTDR